MWHRREVKLIESCAAPPADGYTEIESPSWDCGTLHWLWPERCLRTTRGDQPTTRPQSIQRQRCATTSAAKRRFKSPAAAPFKGASRPADYERPVVERSVSMIGIRLTKIGRFPGRQEVKSAPSLVTARLLPASLVHRLHNAPLCQCLNCRRVGRLNLRFLNHLTHSQIMFWEGQLYTIYIWFIFDRRKV